MRDPIHTDVIPAVVVSIREAGRDVLGTVFVAGLILVACAVLLDDAKAIGTAVFSVLP
ncbi:hypothetical protein [Azospirillum canadense]|uniref:hypothetical protein n=1 Tax=Azospirillum canadense TaxID=403962 RepID=UPI0022264875|nr:hypothetical protein [Azospirillum canadense]MCW2242313.1 hypothetical protein [Azospirillum canadense]